MDGSTQPNPSMKRKFCLTPISSAKEDMTAADNDPLKINSLQDLHITDHNANTEDNADRCVDGDVFSSRPLSPPQRAGKPKQQRGWFSRLKKSLGKDDVEPISRMRTTSICRGEEIDSRKLPTVFKWEGGGKNVFISGSFDNWKCKIPMVRSHGDFYTIVELPEGKHQYKFYVDGSWVCDPSEASTDNTFGTYNNQIEVQASDFQVFEALAMDSRESGHHNVTGISGSPPGEYSQCIPSRNSGQGFHHSGPPILPPHLLQVILNKETPVHCEPTLLPEPNHVMLNHLYALSIKDGVMVLSATHRYRKKYVTTLLYKPI